MQPILTAAEMREVDRRTIEERGVPGLILMENAGLRVYELLAHFFSPLGEQRIVILCGKGNNGGDGLVVARHLVMKGHGRDLKVVLLTDPEALRGDAAANYQMLRAQDFSPTLARSREEWREIRADLASATLIVDALLGTGLRGPAEGLYLDVIRDINTRFAHARVVAVDMPSGLPSDSGQPAGESVRAEHTVTFTAPKVSQIFPPNCERVGRLHVKAIGTALSLTNTERHLQLSLVEPGDIADLFAPRKRAAHKGDFGHVLVVAGSRSKPGAAIMAGTSALRAGAGLVTVATAASAAASVVSHTPELMTEPAAEIEDGSMGESAFCSAWLDRKTVVAVGPGIGVTPSNQKLVRRVIREAEVPVVIDADGLTAMASAGEEDWGAHSRLLVMTPHPGEMARLTGLSANEVQHKRVETAREFAARRNCCLVLKGYRTLIAMPDGRVLVNPTGSPAMASGGSGDILTGLIAGFLAQFPDKPVDIVVAAAVYLHGLAGELAVETRGELSTIATDLLTTLPQAIAAVRKTA